jgi:hypothetical protein
MAFNLKFVAAGAADQFVKIQEENRAYVKDMQEKYRAHLAASGLDKLQKLREGRAQSLANIRKAKSFGFTEEAAILLESSGQLEDQIEKISKLSNTEINKAAIGAISESVINRVTPEYREAVMTEFLNRGVDIDINDLQDRFLQSIFSVADGSIEKATKIISEIPSGSLPMVDPFNISFRGVENLSLSDQNTLDTLVQKEIVENFGGKFVIDPQTQTPRYVGDNEAEVNRITNEIKQQYRTAYSNPDFLDDPQKIITDLGESVRQQALDRRQASDIQVRLTPPTAPSPRPYNPQDSDDDEFPNDDVFKQAIE